MGAAILDLVHLLYMTQFLPKVRNKMEVGESRPGVFLTFEMET